MWYVINCYENVYDKISPIGHMVSFWHQFP